MEVIATRGMGRGVGEKKIDCNGFTQCRRVCCVE